MLVAGICFSAAQLFFSSLQTMLQFLPAYFFSSENAVWRSLCDLHSAGCIFGTIALACSLVAYTQGNILHEEEGRYVVNFPCTNLVCQAIFFWWVTLISSTELLQ